MSLILALVLAPHTPGVDLAPLEPIDPEVRAELARLLHAEAAPVIARHGVPAEKIHLSIGWTDVETIDYDIVLEIDAHDGMPARRDRRPTGADTDQAELGDVVEAALERQLGEWTRAHARASAAESTIAAVPRPPARPDPRPRALGLLGWAGVGTLIAGAAGTGTGIALLVIDPTPHPRDATKLRTWKPGGIALATLGGAAIMTGAVLVAVDARRRRRIPHAAVVPWAGRRAAGVTVRVAF